MKFYLLLAFLLILSCKNKEEQKVVDRTKIDTVSVAELPAKKDSADQEPTFNSENPSDYAEFKNEFDILIPRSYRNWEGKNETDKLNRNWISLVKKNNKYFLEKADYKILKGYDECIGDSTNIIESESALLFLNNSKLKLGPLNSVLITKKKIWPTQKWFFSFNDKKYELQAKGKFKADEKFNSNDGDDAYYDVADYKLYIAAENGPETLLLEQNSFNDTFVELLYIGDIDRDGKPDFIFSANRNYEEERVVLYLSSRAKKGKAAEKVSEIAVQFDC